MGNLFGAMFIQLTEKSDQQSVHLTELYDSYAQLMYELKDKIERMVYIKKKIKNNEKVLFSEENLYLTSEQDINSIISQIEKENEKRKFLPDPIFYSSIITFCWTGFKISSRNSSKSQVYPNQTQSSIKNQLFKCEINGIDDLGEVKSYISLSSSVNGANIEIQVPNKKRLIEIDNDFFFLNYLTTTAKGDTRIFAMKGE